MGTLLGAGRLSKLRAYGESGKEFKEVIQILVIQWGSCGTCICAAKASGLQCDISLTLRERCILSNDGYVTLE